jgi:hypothetical protein
MPFALPQCLVRDGKLACLFRDALLELLHDTTQPRRFVNGRFSLRLHCHTTVAMAQPMAERARGIRAASFIIGCTPPAPVEVSRISAERSPLRGFWMIGLRRL